MLTSREKAPYKYNIKIITAPNTMHTQTVQPPRTEVPMQPLIFSSSDACDVNRQCTKQPQGLAYDIWCDELNKLREKTLSGRVFLRIRIIEHTEYQAGMKGIYAMRYHSERFNKFSILDRYYYQGINIYYLNNGNVQLTLEDLNQFLTEYARQAHLNGFSGFIKAPKKCLSESLNQNNFKPDLTNTISLADFDTVRKNSLTDNIYVNLQFADSKAEPEIVLINCKEGKWSKEIIISQNDFNKFLTAYAEYHYNLGVESRKAKTSRPL